jgi:hypothetical protein
VTLGHVVPPSGGISAAKIPPEGCITCLRILLKTR